jgi:GntR family transcriptional regulator
MVHRARRIPAYIQIAEEIRQKILEGELTPRDRLPAEDVLASTYHVSRMTVRQALHELVQDGLVLRRHGAGTFVAEPKMARASTQMTGFHEDLLSRGLTPTSKVLAAEIRPATANLQKRLGVDSGTPLVYIRRLRFVDGEPAALNWNYLRADLCASLLRADLAERGLYDLIEQECHVALGWVEQRVEARRASKEAAQQLKIRAGSPLLHVERLTYSKDERLVGLMESLYRSDRYVLTSVLYR